MKNKCSIFISYRRSDAPGYVRALMSDLRNTFGSNQVFLDMEGIEAGANFVTIIEQAVGECEVLLAVIGSEWLTVTNELGQRRIDNPEDFICLEIISAFKRNIPVIPVLVGNGRIPKEEELPVPLQALASLQAVTLSHDRWDGDMQKLLLAIENLTVAPRLARQYDAAKLQWNKGYWEDALNEFTAIESVLPNYENVPEITQPLRQLSLALKDTGPESHPWQRIALQQSILLIVVVSLVPHILAAVFNYIFNWQVLVHPMQLRGVQQAEHIFLMFAILMNTVLFLLGIVILVFLVRPIASGLKELANGLTISPEQLFGLRKRCLHLGHLIAVIGLTMWIAAGPIYPILIGALEVRDYVYFVISLAISGLAVATYPFLMVTWLCTHVFYRPLVLPGSVTSGDIALLDQVEGWKWTYLLLAGALPMLVISVGFIAGPQSGAMLVNMLLGIVGIAGLVGFLLALMLFKAIQNDLVLLRQLLWACGSKVNQL